MPLPGFLAAADLKVALAALLKQDVAALPAYWDAILSASNAAAYYDVRGALLARSYSAGQADGWDRGAEFQRDIGLFWALSKGAGLHQLPAEFVEKLDRREELKLALVELSGTVANPAGTPMVVGHGTVDTSTDTYTKSTTW